MAIRVPNQLSKKIIPLGLCLVAPRTTAPARLGHRRQFLPMDSLKLLLVENIDADAPRERDP